MADNSIQSANKNILNLLTDAGGDGLHQDDILYLVGFQDKKQLDHHLRDLKNTNQIVEVEKGRWAKSKSDMNGTATEHSAESFITPSLPEDRPVIHLPGDDKFSSYKNSLQEYCQKKHMSVPQYKPVREENGFIGTVTFSLNYLRCEKVAGSVKEAEGRAAYEALRKLGYLKDHEFQVSVNQNKVSASSNNNNNNTRQLFTVNSGVKAKSGIKCHVTFKMLLNEYAQKMKLPSPVYNTVAVSNSAFSSTVTYNNNAYKCLAVYRRQKDAEQNAAQVALTALLGLTPEELKRNDVGVNYAASMPKQVKSEVTGNISSKSALNEYAQRNKMLLPTYSTVAVTGGFFSTVTFNHNQYKSASPCKRRKDAEQSAAQVALSVLTGARRPDGKPVAINKADATKTVSEAQQVKPQPAALKNRLQEYCQRLGKTLPKYTTVFIEQDKLYNSTVIVQDIVYTGLPQKNKKLAETAAAEQALKALDLMALKPT